MRKLKQIILKAMLFSKFTAFMFFMLSGIMSLATDNEEPHYLYAFVCGVLCVKLYMSLTGECSEDDNTDNE